jgi:N-acetylglucosamine-6-phosphate deacetylase
VNYWAERVVTASGELKNVTLEISDGRFVGVIPDQKVRGEILEGTLIPGFVDIHCHGGGGFDISESEEGARYHLEHGTTSMLASFITQPLEELRSKIKSFRPAKNVLGIHLEGPYLSRDFCGAHQSDLLRVPELSEVLSLTDLGPVKMVTIAPELEGALVAMSALRDRGIIVAIGHSAATGAQTQAAIEAGASVVTHLFNAMRGLHHRESTLASHALTESKIFLELIMDGAHLSYESIRMVAALAQERIIGVTDAAPFAGERDGEYKLAALDVTLKNGIARLKGQESLAGSTLTMDRAFKNSIEKAGFGLVEAVKSFSARPARALEQFDIGDIAVGKRANFLVIDEKLELKETYFAGERV